MTFSRSALASLPRKPSPVRGVIVSALVFVLFAIVGAGFWVARTGDMLLRPSSQNARIEILPGMTLATLQRDLRLDIHPLRYALWRRFFASDVALQVGAYTVTPTTTLEAFFSTTLRSPETQELTLTILPGHNIWDIDASLTRLGMIEAGAFVALARDRSYLSSLEKKYPFLAWTSSLEGFMLPDSYRVKNDFGIKWTIESVLKTFHARAWQTRPASRDHVAFYRDVILASILEREERSAQNLPIVAGILLNRLSQGVALGADATSCYSLEITHRECTPSVILREVFRDTPYDTRRKQWLPPTPISQPSLRALQAVWNPTPTDDLYYLHGSDGRLHTARTLSEHVANKRFLD